MGNQYWFLQRRLEGAGLRAASLKAVNPQLLGSDASLGKMTNISTPPLICTEATKMQFDLGR